MRGKFRFPLLAKVAAWLALHLLVLAAAFAAFIGWQLRLGLDSLLSGATGERLEALGREISVELPAADEAEWPGIIAGKISPYGLEGHLRTEREMRPGAEETEIPRDIIGKTKETLPPPRQGRFPPPGLPGPRGGGPPPRRHFPDAPPPERQVEALFLTKDSEAGNYWAALGLPLSAGGRGRPQHAVLFLKSETATAGGLFFDYRPWLFGGLAVLALSIAMWTPFVLGITRYAGRISRATGRIADGHFDTKIGVSRNDELGAAGESIEEMSARLGTLISGQRRFLADVAHELCAPLARMRTGLGILANQSNGKAAERISSIDEDAGELSILVSELLAFTKANSAALTPEAIPLAEFCGELATRELEGHAVEIAVTETIRVNADRKLLARALRNVLRNCHLHAGADCSVRISATASGDTVNLVVEDDGPGAPEADLPRLFEPFYRPDISRTRDTGGTGLGMAIVESSVRACRGKVAARKNAIGGLLVEFTLPAG